MTLPMKTEVCQDLDAMHAELGKRNPAIREEIDKAGAMIRKWEEITIQELVTKKFGDLSLAEREQDPGSFVESEFLSFAKGNDVVLKPFVLAFKGATPKQRSLQLSLSTIYKFITRQLLGPISVRDILEAFEQKIGGVPEIRLKVLQAVLPLVQDHALVRGDLLMRLFNICLTLVSYSRMHSINTAKVITCHMVSHAFGRVGSIQRLVKSLKDEPALPESAEALGVAQLDLSVAIEDCLSLLAQIFRIAETPGDLSLALDLIAACMFECDEVFARGEFGAVLRDSIMKIVQEVLIANSSLPEVSRSFKILSYVVANLRDYAIKEVGETLRILVDPEVREHVRVLREEFFYGLDYDVFVFFYKWYEKKGLPVLSRHVFSFPKGLEITESMDLRIFYMSQLDRTEIPADPNYVSTLQFMRTVNISSLLHSRMQDAERERHRKTKKKGAASGTESPGPCGGHREEGAEYSNELSDGHNEQQEGPAYVSIPRHTQALDPMHSEIFDMYVGCALASFVSQGTCSDSTWDTLFTTLQKMVAMCCVYKKQDMLKKCLVVLYGKACAAPNERQRIGFQRMAQRITMRVRRIVNENWEIFFDMVRKIVQPASTRHPYWIKLMKKIPRFTDDELTSVIKGLCSSCLRDETVETRTLLSGFFLETMDKLHGGSMGNFEMLVDGIFHKAEDPPRPEVSQILEEVCNTYFEKESTAAHHQVMARKLRDFFLNNYRTNIEDDGRSEHVSFIRAGRKGDLVEEVGARYETALEAGRMVLSVLIRGLRIAGNDMREAWDSIYAILEVACKEDAFLPHAFELLQIIADGHLDQLSFGCLLKTVHCLSLCCIGSSATNIALNSLNSLQSITDYLLVLRRSVRETAEHKKLWNSIICVLSFFAYDHRDNVRDTAISQVFSAIHTAKREGYIDWEPVVRIFFRRLVGAAVYVKDKEIFSGEVSEESEADEAEPKDASFCVCEDFFGCGANLLPAQSPFLSESRAVESTKTLMTTMIDLAFSNFDALARQRDFYSQWKMLFSVCRKFICESAQEEDLPEVLTASILRSVETCSVEGDKYWVHLFKTVSGISQEIPPPPTSGAPLSSGGPAREEMYVSLVRLLRIAYEKVSALEEARFLALFLESLTRMNSCMGDDDLELGKRSNMTPLEKEVLRSLAAIAEEEHAFCPRISVLVSWIGYHEIRRHSCEFITRCFRMLADEFEGGPSRAELYEEGYFEDVVWGLVSFNKLKGCPGVYEVSRRYWGEAADALKRVSLCGIEASDLAFPTFISASREVLGVDLSTPVLEYRLSSFLAVPWDIEDNVITNRNIVKIYESLGPTERGREFASRLRSEESGMMDYLSFLGGVARHVSAGPLREIYELIVLVSETAFENRLHNLLFHSLGMLFDVFERSPSLRDLLAEKIYATLKRFNEDVRLDPYTCSRFRREESKYILKRVSALEGRCFAEPEFISLYLECMEGSDKGVAEESRGVVGKIMAAEGFLGQ